MHTWIYPANRTFQLAAAIETVFAKSDPNRIKKRSSCLVARLVLSNLDIKLFKFDSFRSQHFGSYHRIYRFTQLYYNVSWSAVSHIIHSLPSRLRAFDGACFSLACRRYRPWRLICCVNRHMQGMRTCPSGRAESATRLPNRSHNSHTITIKLWVWYQLNALSSESAVITTIVHPCQVGILLLQKRLGARWFIPWVWN